MRIAGHPVHPALVHFPIALWSLATLLDGLNVTGVTHAFTQAWYCLILGVVMAVPAMATGWFEYTRLNERAVKTGARHMMLMCIVWVLYLAALFSRTQHGALVENPVLITYARSAAGFLTMTVGAWYGGQLVYRHGAGGVSGSSPH